MPAPSAKRRKKHHAVSTLKDIDAINAATRLLIGGQYSWLDGSRPSAADTLAAGHTAIQAGPVQRDVPPTVARTTQSVKNESRLPPASVQAPITTMAATGTPSALSNNSRPGAALGYQQSAPVVSVSQMPRTNAVTISADTDSQGGGRIPRSSQTCVPLQQSGVPNIQYEPYSGQAMAQEINNKRRSTFPISIPDSAHRPPFRQDPNHHHGHLQLGLGQTNSLPSPASIEEDLSPQKNASAPTATLSAWPNPIIVDQHSSGTSLSSLPSDSRSSPDSADMLSASACSRRFITFSASQTNLLPMEKHMLDLIEYAVRNNDWFYMILSQILSCHRSGSIPVFYSFIPPVDLVGLRIVDKIVGSGGRINPLVASFLQSFPIPSAVVMQSQAGHDTLRMCSGVAACVLKLRSDWEPMLLKSKVLKCLPLPRDLLTTFGMQSPILQRLSFSALLQSTWDTRISVFTRKAVDHFHQQQQRLDSARSNEPDDPQLHYRYFRALYAQHVALCDTGTMNVGEPTHVARLQHLPSQSQSSQQPNFFSRMRNASTDSWQSSSNPSVRDVQNGPRHHEPASSATPAPAILAVNTRNSTQPHVTQTRNSSATLSGLSPALITASGSAIGQPAHPNYLISALHQAHLRDATLVAVDATKAAVAPSEPEYYRYVSMLCLSPRPLSTQPIEELSFEVIAEHLACIPSFMDEGRGAPAIGSFDTNSVMFRLRCCQAPKDSSDCWMTQENVWPTWLYFSLNDKPLDTRRKLQHGRSLPIEITEYLDRTNTLKVVKNLASTENIPQDLSVGVEMVVFATKEKLGNDCLTTRFRPAEEVRQDLVSSLSKSYGVDEDNEMAITQATIVIALFEPFSNARIFDVPVRSKNCKHREAFDLDVFLETRGYNGETTRVSKVDDWRCPICGADARPPCLYVDGYLVEVREALRVADALDTRAIIVNSDGSFTAKQETQSGKDLRGTRDAGHETRLPAKRSIEVVELDSD